MKRRMRLGVHAIIIVLVVATTSAASLTATSARTANGSVSASFVTRAGAQLLLDGQPFTFTGVNMFHANSDGWCRGPNPLTDAELKGAFHALGHGNVVLRAWFFQAMATKKWTGERDWYYFDRTLAFAKEAGVHVIVTLTDQAGECGDGGIGVYKTRDWYNGGYLYPDPAETDPTRPNHYAQWVSYYDYVQEVVLKYKDDPTIMAWQLINEAEVKVAFGDSACPSAASAAPPPPAPSGGPQPSAGPSSTPTRTPAPTPQPQDSLTVLKTWATAMADAVRASDTNHLISLGTIGSGQCGASGPEYQDLHSIPNIDLCEYHDYSLDAIPSDPYNGLPLRLQQCAALNKPLFVGESGITANSVGGLAARSALFDDKFRTQFAAGVVGELMWMYSSTPSTLDAYDIGPGDPALRRFQSVPDAPTNVIAGAGDGTATVSWKTPSWDGATDILDYTIYGNGAVLGTAGANAGSASVAVTNGTSYSFTVAARNAVGLSAPSGAASSVTPLAGAAPPAVVTSDVPPATSTTVTTGAAAPTPTDPLTTTVIVPATQGGGSITVVETASTGTPPSGYQLMGQQVDIVSTAGTSASNPLTIIFTVDESAVRTAFKLGATGPLPLADNVAITRAEGTGAAAVIGPCTTFSPAIVPDPCVSKREFVGGDFQATVLTSAASHWTTVIRPVAVTVLDAGYLPRVVTVQQGGPVSWTFSGTRAHTVTDASRLGTATKPAMFNSGPLMIGGFGYVFRAAGTYPYGSTAMGDTMAGAVEVPVLVSPTAGTTATAFVITSSSATIPGYVFDISYRFQPVGGKTWTEWKWQAGQTATTRTFTPPRGAGTYAVIARIRNSTSGNASAWSPETRISVRAP